MHTITPPTRIDARSVACNESCIAYKHIALALWRLRNTYGIHLQRLDVHHETTIMLYVTLPLLQGLVYEQLSNLPLQP
jgi:hypothetical protein